MSPRRKLPRFVRHSRPGSSWVIRRSLRQNDRCIANCRKRLLPTVCLITPKFLGLGPYIGFNPNADYWKAEGVSTYNALQLQATKRMSYGLMVNASYTYSHSLDEGSGLGAGLFFNGNNPLVPRTAYASSDFDRTHVLTISYVYQLRSLRMHPIS